MRNELSTDQGCILRGLRVVIPPKFRQRLLQELHHEHFGIVKTKAMARGYFWYPGLDHDIEEMIKSCEPCLAFRNAPSPSPLIPWPYPAGPWERIHIDFGYFEGQNFLVLVDSYSKWVELALMPSITSSKLIVTL